MSKPSNQHPREKTDFSRFDQARVALVLTEGEREFVFTGVAAFDRDDQLGNILRIRGKSKLPPTEFLISEESWSGEIVRDFQHGCHFCLIAATPIS